MNPSKLLLSFALQKHRTVLLIINSRWFFDVIQCEAVLLVLHREFAVAWHNFVHLSRLQAASASAARKVISERSRTITPKTEYEAIKMLIAFVEPGSEKANPSNWTSERLLRRVRRP